MVSLNLGGVPRFITFEGGEGSGKTVQSARLVDYLRRCGVSVLATREPGGPIGGGDDYLVLMRQIFMSPEHSLSSFERLLLVVAMRGYHWRHHIAPALAGGVWVVCDRFIDSTRAYQLVEGEGVFDDALILSLHHRFSGFRMPDLTFVFDVEPALGLARRVGERDVFQCRDLGYHGRVREAYHRIVAEEGGRCVMVDGGRGMDVVSEEVCGVLGRFGL